MAATSTDPLVWIDCEMTGLNPDTDTILSVGCFITSHDLTLLDSAGFEATVTHSRAQLDAMDDWCTATHAASALSARCLDATKSQDAETVAMDLVAYVKRYIPEPRRGLLAGNSVHADRAFLRKGPWAALVEHLHYRILDVSAIKEAARRWASPEAMSGLPAKAGKHEARADILESIEEARFYKEKFFDGK